MKKAVCVEIVDKRDKYISEAFKEEGFVLFSSGEEKLYPEYEKIYVRSLLTEVTAETASRFENNSILFSRKLNEKTSEILREKNIACFNLLEDETFIVRNAYITAEGALAYIITNTDASICRMPILVLGYGRVGKSVTKILKDNYAEVSVATNDRTEFALAAVYSEEVLGLGEIKNRLGKFSAIVNTVPKLILEGETLNFVNKDCFILDLASKPGGVDFAAAEKLGLNYLHALGVPGKVAPKTAGLYIKDIVMKKLS
jgi:dipicolinate synthase subunit A